MRWLNYIVLLIYTLLHLQVEEQSPLKPQHPDQPQKLTYYQFSPNQMHKDYIKDSIQPPAPYRPIQITTLSVPLQPNIKGLTEQIDPFHYLILLSPYWQDRDHTYMHELIHVRQLARKQLSKQGQIWYWNHKPIDWMQPYHDRAWEQDAETSAYQYEHFWYQKHEQD
jgi:hypothetical protein